MRYFSKIFAVPRQRPSSSLRVNASRRREFPGAAALAESLWKAGAFQLILFYKRGVRYALAQKLRTGGARKSPCAGTRPPMAPLTSRPARLPPFPWQVSYARPPAARNSRRRVFLSLQNMPDCRLMATGRKDGDREAELKAAIEKIRGRDLEAWFGRCRSSAGQANDDSLHPCVFDHQRRQHHRTAIRADLRYRTRLHG
jgi:hypothetical protein